MLTNGCFDLLHVGHVRYLESARRMGDALVVAVNSDRSVRKLKGELRPITPEAERAEIVAALACVDFVTVFDDSTALALIRTVRPAVYVKGGDYSDDSSSPRFPAEGTQVRSYGGEIVILPLERGHSTSLLVARLLDVMGP